MTDHDDLKQLLADVRPPNPTPGARARAKDAALASFDAEAESFSTAHQGNTDQDRQRVRQSGLMTKLRSFLMNMTLPSTRTMMMGGSSLAVFAIAIMAVQTMNTDIADFSEAPVAVTSADGLPDAPTLKDQITATGRSEQKTVPTRLQEETETNAPTPDPAITLGDSGGSLAGDELRRDAEKLDSRLGGLREPEPQVEAEAAAAPPEPLAVAPAKPASSAPRQRADGNAQGRLNAQERSNQTLDRFAKKEKPSEQPTTGLAQTEADADEEAPADLVAKGLLSGEEVQGRDQFDDVIPNPVVVTSESPISTFSVDVDTASYAFMRNALMQGVLPQKNAVRIEELINYFPYDYARPEDRDVPFTSDVSVMPTPWNDGTKLMRIGIQGYELAPEQKPRSNLVFLLDTSGSMNAPDKLPLLIRSFSLMVDNLDEDDTVSIVVYAGSAGTVLQPTKVKNKDDILAALNRLQAGGSTAGGEGIRQAYKLSEQNFDKNGINRVILATDGDFNVGIQNTEELKSFIERKRETGVFLSVLGFGQGNYNDALMQALAQNGNGNAAYIDTIQEARKVLVDEASSTLFPIAKDVKIQVEFNPATVGEYRLVGFETRILNREDFNNDKIDAGEIGAGHSVTALYEITPVDSNARLIDESRYGMRDTFAGKVPTPHKDEYAFVKIRYKQPDANESQLITQPVTIANEAEPDTEARFAAAVAAFGQLLRGGRHTGDYSYDDVVALAKGALGDDPFGYRAEFVDLARRAAIADAMERQ